MVPQRYLTMIMQDHDEQYKFITISQAEILAAGDTSSNQSSISTRKLTVSSDAPSNMTFISMAMAMPEGGTKIYMVGGFDRNSVHLVPSKRVLIYDSVSQDIEEGPRLNSGKREPILISIGTNIYALSKIIGCYGNHHDQPPFLEVLDTSELTAPRNGASPPPRWLKLPNPVFPRSPPRPSFIVQSWAVYDNLILISVKNFGIFSYNTASAAVWRHMSEEVFPFFEYALRHTSSSSSTLWYGLSMQHWGEVVSYRMQHWGEVVSYRIQLLEGDQLPLISVTELAVVYPYTTPPMPPLKDIFHCDYVLVPTSSGDDYVESDNKRLLYILEAGLDTDFDLDEEFDRLDRSKVGCFVNVSAYEIDTHMVARPRDDDGDEYDGKKEEEREFKRQKVVSLREELQLRLLSQACVPAGPMVTDSQHLVAAFPT